MPSFNPNFVKRNKCLTNETNVLEQDDGNDSDTSTILDTSDDNIFDPDDPSFLPQTISDIAPENSNLSSMGQHSSSFEDVNRICTLQDFPPSNNQTASSQYSRNSRLSVASVMSGDATSTEDLFANRESTLNASPISFNSFPGMSSRHAENTDNDNQRRISNPLHVHFGAVVAGVGLGTQKIRNEGIPPNQRLKRSISVPLPHYACHGGDVTPGGVSMSQPEKSAEVYRTPNSEVHLKICGKHGYDWATTEGANATVIKALDHLYFSGFQESFNASEEDRSFNSRILVRGITEGGNNLPNRRGAKSTELHASCSMSDFSVTPFRTESFSTAESSFSHNYHHSKMSMDIMGANNSHSVSFSHLSAAPSNFSGIPDHNRGSMKAVPSAFSHNLRKINSINSYNMDSGNSPFSNNAFQSNHFDATSHSPHASHIEYSQENRDSNFSGAIVNSSIWKPGGSSSTAFSPTSKFDANSSRRKKNLRTSKEKWQRMSMGFSQSTKKKTPYELHGCEEDIFEESQSQNESCSSISPAAKAKFSSGLLNRRRLIGSYDNSIDPQNSSSEDMDHTMRHFIGGMDDSMCENSFVDMLPSGDGDDNDCHQQSIIHDLNEMNFKGVITCGTYQQCFEDGIPVVAPPLSTEKRVVSTQLQHNGSLDVKVYLPKERSFKLIRLGQNWKWMRCNPTGFLVFKDHMEPGKCIICYFTSRNPIDCDNSGGEIAEDALLEIFQRTEESHIFFGQRSQENKDFKEIKRSSSFSSSLFYSESNCEVSESSSSSNSNYVFTSSDSTDRLIHPAIEIVRTNTIDEMMMNLSTESHSTSPFSDHHPSETSLLFSNISDWNNTCVIALILEFLVATGSTADVLRPQVSRLGRKLKPQFSYYLDPAYRLVNKSWALASYRLKARHLCITENAHAYQWSEWANVMNKYSWGKFISQGACKEVYCVQGPHMNHVEAVSIMDIDDLKDRGVGDAISQELEISMLCSSLVSLGVCPNLVQVHSVFQCAHPPLESLWRSSLPSPRNTSSGISKAVSIPKSNCLTKGKYQYIRMEFCSGGDLEELVRSIRLPSIDSTRSMLFQMCFSLYACREQLSLRHYDIKLLNFFVTTGSALLTAKNRQVDETMKPNSMSTSTQLFPSDGVEQKHVVLKIGFGSWVFKLNINIKGNELIKLADFGTSAIGSGGLGDPITVQQFTTLENTPPEFLLLGSAARQSYSADTFCVGLAMLHLLTGQDPYEELLKDVKCPKYLENALRKYWSTENPGSPYFVISEVINSLDDSTVDDNGERPAMVLFHTLYRYMVLFDVPLLAQVTGSGSNNIYANNPIWLALVDALGGAINSDDNSWSLAQNNRGNRRAASKKVPSKGTTRDDCLSQYSSDRSTWSINNGSHDIMNSVRQRLEALGYESRNIFEKTVNFDPSKRCTMHEVICSSVFSPLRGSTGPSPSHSASLNMFDSRGKPPRASSSSRLEVSYMHYYRGHGMGSDSLPML